MSLDAQWPYPDEAIENSPGSIIFKSSKQNGSENTLALLTRD